MFISRKKVRRSLLTKLFIVLLLAAVALVSCASPPARDSSSIKKVDGKVLEEFYEGEEKGDFYAAAKSYIEFLNCCSDERAAELQEKLTQLYRKKMDEFKLEGKNLDAVEYTYSYLHLMDELLGADERLSLERDLESYIVRYVERDLAGKGDFEKISWLMYVDRLTSGRGSAAARSALLNLFLERRNPRMSAEYLSLLEQTDRGNDESQSGADRLGESVSKLKALSEDISEGAIDRTVKSSVKVIVDRGITTKGGVGMPDQSLGTGIVIDPRSYILTNYHIIESDVDPSYEGYSRVYVISGRDENVRYVAHVVGYDSVFDLALLKIEKELPSFVMAGDSDILKQGEKVLAIGNPVGLTNTVTSGVVSSIDRPFLQIGGIIQIDAALNPGNSGGALIDNDGYLVGVTFAGLANFENLNFAIPSNHVFSILRKLYQGGETSRSWLGCSVDEREGEIVVEYIVPNSPADVCNLQQGDVIVSLNGQKLSSVYQLQETVADLNNPMVVTMAITRDGKTAQKKLYVSERPVQPSLYIYKRDALERILAPMFGIVLSSVESDRRKFNAVKRVLHNSVASSVGIAEGDMIRIRELKYDEETRVFYLIIELESKRFGYINKNMILYRYLETNTFI
jgi:S1-C subfamily serine protease